MCVWVGGVASGSRLKSLANRQRQGYEEFTAVKVSSWRCRGPKCS